MESVNETVGQSLGFAEGTPGARLNGAATESGSTATGTVGPAVTAKNRRRWFRPVLFALAVIAVVSAAAWCINARRFESTDDAFVEGRVIPVASKVEGYVVALNVDDNQHVSAGDVIAEIDPRDFQAAVDEARANLTAEQKRLADARATLAVLGARVDQARAGLAATEAEGSFARQDAQRYRAMAEGTTSLQDRQRADSVDKSADAKILGARSNVTAAEAGIAQGQTAVAVAEAQVATAEARLRQPELNLQYTKIIAPQSGRVARRTVEKGAYTKPGQSLLAIVPDDMWVVANFKENQLAEIRNGQPVQIELDAYPGRKFSGHVDSIQAGSGGRFSLLPPENATGNYVKVVQRVPVKIRFDESPASMPLLAPGMSVEPEVKVR